MNSKINSSIKNNNKMMGDQGRAKVRDQAKMSPSKITMKRDGGEMINMKTNIAIMTVMRSIGSNQQTNQIMGVKLNMPMTKMGTWNTLMMEIPMVIMMMTYNLIEVLLCFRNLSFLLHDDDYE